MSLPHTTDPQLFQCVCTYLTTLITQCDVAKTYHKYLAVSLCLYVISMMELRSIMGPLLHFVKRFSYFIDLREGVASGILGSIVKNSE